MEISGNIEYLVFFVLYLFRHRGGNSVGGQSLKCLEELKYLALKSEKEVWRKKENMYMFHVQAIILRCTLSFSHSAAHPLLLRYRWSLVILGGVLQSWRRWRRWLHLWRLSGRWLCRFPDSLRWWRACSQLTCWHMRREAEKLTCRQRARDPSSVC